MKQRGDLAVHLRKELKSRFSGNGLRLYDGPEPVASFEPISSSWTPVEVVDHWDEATVHLGDFTHVHFGNYNDELPDEVRMSKIAEDVSEFLTELFNDQIEVWRGRFSGGCRKRGTQAAWARRIFGNRAIVWSGELSTSRTQRPAYPQRWSVLSTIHSEKFSNELQSEICKGHPLYGLPLVAVARLNGFDDFLFKYEGEEERCFVVHLTWRKETDPDDPSWTMFKSHKDFCANWKKIWD